MQEKPSLDENNFVFFWQSDEENGIFGQWSNHPFTVNGVHFPTAEHYMMYHKALLFQDKHSAEQIASSNDPATVKALGRKVSSFDREKWEANRLRIVTEGNVGKFSQNQEAKVALMQTGDKLIVEASPEDRIWGIGFTREEALKNMDDWGLNLLGQALMETRKKLRQERIRSVLAQPKTDLKTRICFGCSTNQHEHHTNTIMSSDSIAAFRRTMASDLHKLAEDHLQHDLHQSDRDLLMSAGNSFFTFAAAGTFIGLSLGALSAYRLRAAREAMFKALRTAERPTHLVFADGRQEAVPDLTSHLKPSRLGGIATYVLLSTGGMFLGGETGALLGSLRANQQIKSNPASYARIQTAFRNLRVDMLKKEAEELEKGRGNLSL
ncbi:hypothetical protein PROFUN_01726 [Planoprotostelium fungivorum]|uniref:NADAR domain-containing protein n=1 Tax=Planoprotostelium fungivorum TaxID=1890364 RepID=A0A2P6MWB6_9EUKA|nr:hypothetical protein PROFUN_01726 [Planoprotostelium fungivorum]